MISLKGPTFAGENGSISLKLPTKLDILSFTALAAFFITSHIALIMFLPAFLNLSLMLTAMSNAAVIHVETAFFTPLNAFETIPFNTLNVLDITLFIPLTTFDIDDLIPFHTLVT